jgi:hypothetical protein
VKESLLLSVFGLFSLGLVSGFSLELQDPPFGNTHQCLAGPCDSNFVWPGAQYTVRCCCYVPPPASGLLCDLTIQDWYDDETDPEFVCYELVSGPYNTTEPCNYVRPSPAYTNVEYIGGGPCIYRED